MFKQWIKRLVGVLLLLPTAALDLILLIVTIGLITDNLDDALTFSLIRWAGLDY